jgi:hypothetical protein
MAVAPRSSRLALVVAMTLLLCGAVAAERQLLSSRNEGGRKSRAAKLAEKACERANPGCDDCVDDGTGTLTYYCARCDYGYLYDLEAESVCTCDAAGGFASLTKLQWRAFVRAGIVKGNPPRKTVVVPQTGSGYHGDDSHDDGHEHIELGRCTLCSAFGNFEVDPEGSGNCVPVV